MDGRECRCQAIAKADTVTGNAARLGRRVHLCLCKTPGQGRLAALLLLVRNEDATGVGRDVRIVVRSDSGNKARAR